MPLWITEPFVRSNDEHCRTGWGSRHREQAGELTLDASQVARIHTAAVQVLCAFVQARREAGLGTGFHGCTATFRDAARLLGVTQALGLDVTHDNLKSVENAA